MIFLSLLAGIYEVHNTSICIILEAYGIVRNYSCPQEIIIDQLAMKILCSLYVDEND